MKKSDFVCTRAVGCAVVLGGLALLSARAEKVTLFNGKDLSGWTSVADHDVTGGYSADEPTWFVKAGTILTTGTPFGYLRTKRSDFGDFRLHVEYRWWRETEKPNSGVFVRLAAERGTFIPTCIENQLCRGMMGDVLGLAGFRLAGFEPRSPYDPKQPLSGITKVPRKGADVEKPFGEWNVMEIELKGGTLVNRVNGVELNRLTGIAVPAGAIALQSEGGAVQFRNIWVEELESEAKAAVEAARQAARARFAKDAEQFDQSARREIERLYRVVSSRSEAADEALKTLTEKFPKANRTGCAVMYAAQRERDTASRERLLKLAKDQFGDCRYGDGAQVAAYARWYLAKLYAKTGRADEAQRLFDEIRTDYPDAVTHQGALFATLLPKNANPEP